jgi:exosome complex component RRP41
MSIYSKIDVPKKLFKNGLRLDGRKPDELRPTRMEVGVLNKANGSAYLEQGRNKILVGVYGPREAHPKHIALSNRATIRCRYHMAPFSTDERRSPAPSRRDAELSKVIREALEPSILSHLYPRTTIDIYIEILQSDGGTRCGGINCASLALADAGIPLKDMVSACAVGKIEGKIVIDLDDLEDKFGEADLPVALMPNAEKITLIQMDGDLSIKEFQTSLDWAIKSCKKINEIQKKSLREKYLHIDNAEESPLALGKVKE